MEVETYTRNLQKIGKTFFLSIPREVVNRNGWTKKMPINLFVKDDVILLKKSRTSMPKEFDDFKELTAKENEAEGKKEETPANSV